MSDWKISNVEALKLIRSYNKHECLWNINKAEYKRLDLKQNAWTQLSKEFARSIHDLKKKMKHLRTAYLVERKKVEESRKTCTSPDMIYEPNLFYYKEFSFLDPIIVLRKTGYRFDMTQNIAQESTETAQANDQLLPTPSPSISLPTYDEHPKRKRKIPRRTSAHDCVSDSLDETKEKSQESLYSSFGKVIALQLEQLTPVEATITMDQIHRVLSRSVMQSLMARTRAKSIQDSQTSSLPMNSPESDESTQSQDPLQYIDLPVKYE